MRGGIAEGSQLCGIIVWSDRQAPLSAANTAINLWARSAAAWPPPHSLHSPASALQRMTAQQSQRPRLVAPPQLDVDEGQEGGQRVRS